MRVEEEGKKKRSNVQCSQVNLIWLACIRNVFKHWFGYESSVSSLTNL